MHERLEFSSPTLFSRGGADLLLPDPRLMADSWQRRWNTSLPPGDPLFTDDEPWRETRRLLCALSRFAEYCGTGAQVTHGFGLTRLVPPL